MFDPPASERELVDRSRGLAGRTLRQAAVDCGIDLPASTRSAKGRAGIVAETWLGATARNLSEPDFQLIGVELKTLPLGGNGRPRESTYVCTVPLVKTSDLKWETSAVKRKLNRVLWLPVEGDPAIPWPERRFGSAFLWSPDTEQETMLKEDWEEHMDRIATGELDRIDSRHGRVLQIRPKAANARALGPSFDEDGNPAATLPRGFYLRTSFTREILEKHLREG